MGDWIGPIDFLTSIQGTRGKRGKSQYGVFWVYLVKFGKKKRLESAWLGHAF